MQISSDVRAELSAAKISASGLELTLTRQVDRKLYRAINQVLEALGGKWARRAGAHVFTTDVRPRLEAALDAHEVTTDADLGFFQTPEPLARRLVELADVRRDDYCLEPSAGLGRIVYALLDIRAIVAAIEWDFGRRQKLSGIYDEDGHIHVHAIRDFMEFTPDEPFDRVVMNPPFLKVGLGDHLDHVRHAYGMLAPGGVLVSVLPSGVRFREDRRHRDFRAWAEARGAFEDLPADSFKESGTGVNTCVVRLVGGVA